MCAIVVCCFVSFVLLLNFVCFAVDWRLTHFFCKTVTMNCESFFSSRVVYSDKSPTTNNHCNKHIISHTINTLSEASKDIKHTEPKGKMKLSCGSFRQSFKRTLKVIIARKVKLDQWVRSQLFPKIIELFEIVKS